ncbi:TonB-dependent receptor [Flavobacterium silvaticum]|uniref:TonB-dependent receptor n=1 Tax=Flavobacterium silvaticum TaxID=1852020 RepID=A0A972JIJ1_9FLAO|nr:TonB-dependent receptor [Flavobacterium silvaticum]NMH27297.1 TonB-dependent receptor [Flavobacterium silvaticum]
MLNNGFLWLFLLIPFFCKSQSVSGFIKSDGKAVTEAIAYIKSVENPDIILGFSGTRPDGSFMIDLQTTPQKVIVEIRSMNHEFFQQTYDWPKNETTLKVSIALTEKPFELKEVVVSQKPAIQQKKDTVVYNVDKFRDGSEKVIEDILKKLPGVKIDNNGQVTYNGKQIKKLLFNGDDLFNEAYSMGTKNINSDMIESVEAYKNYNEHIQLKGITDSEDDVALNIKLKKDKGDVSGGLELGAGHKDVWNTRFNSLFLYKGFTIFNVTGYNNTNIDYGTNGMQKRIENAPKTLIFDETSQYVIDDKYAQVKKNFLSGTHSVLKLTPKTNLRLAGNYSSDRFLRQTENQTTIQGPGQIMFNTTENSWKSPKRLDVSTELKSDLSKKLYLEYNVNVQREQSSTTAKIDNNGTLQHNELEGRKEFLRQEVKIIARLADSVGMESSVIHYDGKSPQEFFLYPGVFASSVTDFQFAQIQTQKIESKTTLSGTRKQLKWQADAGCNFERDKLRSNLKSDSSDIPDNRNDDTYKHSVPYFSASVAYKFKSFAFRTGLKATYFDLGLRQTDTTQQALKKFVLNPSIRFMYLLNSANSITAGYASQTKEPTIDFLFRQNITTNFRTLRSNIPELALMPVHVADLRFAHGSILNLPTWDVRLSVTKTDKNYFSGNFVSEQLSYISGRLLAEPMTTYNVDFSLRNYFSPLKLTYEINAGYSDTHSRSNVNSFDLVKSRLQSMTLKLTIRNRPKAAAFVENNASYNFNHSGLEGISGFDFSGLEDELRIVYKIVDKWRAEAKGKFYYPDLSKPNAYCFADASVTYDSPKGLTYSLIANNLLNHKTFTNSNINEISRTYNSFNLMRAYVMASIRFQW